VACKQNIRPELNSILVEGHTDSSAKDPAHGVIHNLILSQQRSMEVVKSSLDLLHNEGNGSWKCFLDLVSASGRGSSDLILNENREEDPDKSRRVQFKIRVRSFEEREVQTGDAALNTLTGLRSSSSLRLSGDSNGNQPGKY
jgi:flagellar motor protein MotB